MGLTTLGNLTPTILLHTENHKTTVTFVTAADLKKGQPVKLNTDGEIIPWASTDGVHKLIGIAYANSTSGEVNTVWTRGYAIVNATVAGAVNAGIGTFNQFRSAGTNQEYPEWKAATDATDTMGWILEKATAADQIVRVLVMD